VDKRIVAIACALALFAPLRAPAAMPGPDDAIGATQALYEKTLIEDISATMVQEGSYMVAWWKPGAEAAPGCALLHKTDGTWKVLKMGRASLVNAATLESLGVPAGPAQALVRDVGRGSSLPAP
jgi:hypothetical protein